METSNILLILIIVLVLGLGAADHFSNVSDNSLDDSDSDSSTLSTSSSINTEQFDQKLDMKEKVDEEFNNINLDDILDDNHEYFTNDKEGNKPAADLQRATTEAEDEATADANIVQKELETRTHGTDVQTVDDILDDNHEYFTNGKSDVDLNKELNDAEKKERLASR